MSADRDIVRKALLAACGEIREGERTDAIGAAVVTASDGEGDSDGVAGGAGMASGADRADGTDRTGGAGGASGGLVPAFVASPGSTPEAAAVMRVAAEHGLAVVPRGGGSRLGWGVPPSGCDLIVDLSRMNAVVEHASGDLVARVQAGARMGSVAEVLARAGQELALDVPPDATVGGVIGSGLAGPRRLRYGTPRDLLIGVTIVRADGTVAKSGGKVLKNVAGYDLGKLMAGAAGTLALVTEATFRLHPLPAARAWVTAEYASTSVAADAVAAAANSPLTASAVEIMRLSGGAPIRVAVLLEGSADGVAARAMRMADLLGSAEVTLAPPSWWPGSRPADGPGAGGSVSAWRAGTGGPIRVSFWVSALGRVLDAVDAAAHGARMSAVVRGAAGAGVLDIRVGQWVAGDPQPPQETARRVAEFVRLLRQGLAGARGAVTVLHASAPLREALAEAGGMHGTVPGLSLMRAVKDQFDPGHRLAPGRFPEGI